MLYSTWLIFVPAVLGRFTFPYRACWRRNCIYHNDADTVCFDSSDNGILDRPCEDATLGMLLDMHVNSSVGLSIAYYDEMGNFLGPSTWSVPKPLPFAIYVCMSGRRTDVEGPAYRTICRSSIGDDDIRIADAHRRECAAAVPQEVVTDGCYTASRARPAAPKSASILDSPLLGHIFFVLGAVTTIAALYSMVMQFRRPVLGFIAGCLSRAKQTLTRSTENGQAPVSVETATRNIP